MKKTMVFPYSMTSPTIIILALLTIFPLLYTIYYSLTDFYYLAAGEPKFIGLENYVKIIQDSYFRQAVGNTVKFTILAVVFESALGLAIAILVNSIRRGNKMLRTIILLPTLLPPVTVALVWQIMFSNNYGIINKLIGYVGIAPRNWLMEVSTAFYAILAIDIWQYTPFAFLLIYASLQTVPLGQYEAATIDGANKWQQFRYITVPNILNSIILVVLLRTIDSFRLFDKVNILTKGGPANSTATITQYIYLNGIRNLKVGYGAAASLIMTVLVLLLSSVYVKKAFAKK